MPTSSTPLVVWQWGSWRLVVERVPFGAGELRRMYDALAPGWSVRRAGWGFDEAYTRLCEALSEELEDALRLGPVVDVGAGDGGFTAALVRARRCAVSVDAVDLSPAMLEVALARLGGAACDVRAHLGAAEALPLGDATAGVVLVGHVLEHLASPELALAEARRVLKPGGLLLVVATRCAVVGRVLQLRWRLRCHEPDQARAALGAAGFDGVIRSLSGGWRLRRASLAWVGRRIG